MQKANNIKAFYEWRRFYFYFGNRLHKAVGRWYLRAVKSKGNKEKHAENSCDPQ